MLLWIYTTLLYIISKSAGSGNGDALPRHRTRPSPWHACARVVVVHDQVDIKILGDGRLDLPQEPQELLMSVPGLALADHLTGGHVQGGEQRGGAVADVVMGDALDVTEAHGQQRLSPVQGLDLRLLVDSEHQRLVRWIQIEADDVADLLHEERILRQLECLLPMRLH
jgi:hypothetical protein